MGRWISASVASGCSSGRGWVRDSISPLPARPALAPPLTENVASQTASSRRGAAGERRSAAARTARLPAVRNGATRRHIVALTAPAPPRLPAIPSPHPVALVGGHLVEQ